MKYEREMKITLLTQWFDPEPAVKGKLFADALAFRGHDVEVVTGYPNYPGGKLYDGYRIRPIAREWTGRARVTRLPLYPSHDSSIIKRALNYISFAASALIYMMICAKRSDVIYAYHPPLSVPLVAILVGFVRRTPVVLDVQDIWPDSLVSGGILADSIGMRLIERLCLFCYRRAHTICVLSDGFAKLLNSRGVPIEKIRVIPNWAHDEQGLLSTVPGVGPSLNGTFRIIYTGNMGPAQDLTTILEAAENVSARDDLEARSILFILLGSGIARDELVLETQRRKLKNVVFLPRVTPAEATKVISDADALLVHLKDDELFRITIPSKIQTYLCAGRPILCGVQGDAAQIVKRAHAGECVPSGNAAAIADAAVALASRDRVALDVMGRAGREYYLENMSLNSAVDAFDAALSAAAGGNG